MIKKNNISRVERRAFVEEFALTSVALALSDAIRASGKTQRQIADELDVSEARISQVLTITGNPTVRTLARIADAVGRELRVEFADDCHVPAVWEVISEPYEPANMPTEFIERELSDAA